MNLLLIIFKKKTKYYILLSDYVAIYRKGGYPIAVNLNNHSDPDENIKLKDIPVPPNSQM